MAKNELLEIDIYSDFEADLYGSKDPNFVKADPDQENPNLTYGEIFDPNPLDKKQFSEMQYLYLLANSDPNLLDKAAKQSSLMVETIPQIAQQELERYGGIDRLRQLNEYVKAYSVQEVSPESPPQRLESTPVGETMIRPTSSYRRGMGPPLLTDDVELLEKRRQEMLTEDVRNQKRK